MADLEFQISYSAPALPAWEASRALRGITHLYYCGLVAHHDMYPTILESVYHANGELLPEDLPARLSLSEDDRFFLELRSLSPRLTGKASSRNETAVRNASDAMQVLKRLRGEVCSKGMTDRGKMERIEASKEIQQLLLDPIQACQLDEKVRTSIRGVALVACLALLAEAIESIELIFRGSS